MKIITDPSGILLGVHVIGPQAPCWCSLACLMNAGGERQLKDRQHLPISRSMVIHPR